MKSKLITSLLLFVLLLDSCNVHQWPSKSDEPVQPTNTVKVPLKLTYQTDFYMWHHEYDPNVGKIEQSFPDASDNPGYPGTTSKYSNIAFDGVMDIFVKAYKANNASKPVLEQTFTRILSGDSYDCDIELELEPYTNYLVAVWSHLRIDPEAGHFYDPADFNRVQLISSNYKGNTDYRDGFSSTMKISTGEFDEAEPYALLMTRPMGKFELVTIDLSEFLLRETSRRGLASRARADEYHVQISYPYYLPNSYSTIDDRLEYAVSGVSFMTKMSVNGETEASLGFDYVFLNPNSDAVQMKVDIYDPSYTHVAGSTVLSVPMRRDCHTVLRGTFLMDEGEGGIGIDPSFDGEHTVIL